MITSKHASVVGLFGLLALAATQGCGSDSDTTAGFTAGSSGAPTTGAAGVSGSGVAVSPSAGAPSAGAPGAGAPAGGAGTGGDSTGTGGDSTGTGGSSAGTGGSSAGTGGSSAGTGGGSTAGAGGGGSTVTFAQVKSLFGTSCGVGNCHNKASGHLDYQGTTDLHGLLTSPIPAGTKDCIGTTPVTANDANSFLLKVVMTGGIACPMGTGTIPRMPDGCKATGGTPCLTNAQVKLISDWIAAGAKGT
jgi:hypothetical protein